MKINIVIVAAMDKNRVIGKNGTLPWKIPSDLKLFKRLTLENAVIMGRKTFFSLPEKYRPLPDRLNIVVSHSIRPHAEKGVLYVSSLWNGIGEAYQAGKKNPYIIGGEAIFREAVLFADSILLSEIDAEIEGGDAHFPKIKESEWEKFPQTGPIQGKDDEYPYVVNSYVRRRS